MFESAGMFVNMGRVAANTLRNLSNHICPTGSYDPAVGIMLGCVHACSIVNHVTLESGSYVRQLVLLPFPFDLQLNAAAWGKIYNLGSLYGDLAEDEGIYFSTKRMTPNFTPDGKPSMCFLLLFQKKIKLNQN